ncbi:MAG TPA: hypothetical protein VG345_12875 [Bryobacteraceae bacterium]|nr:hypothetical protein [Bryobacteraceae bacterium]
MESFFENAQRILDVAATADANGPEEFAVLMGGDGGLRILMNQPFRLDAAAADLGAAVAYRVVRSRSGVRVEGHGRGQDCVLETRKRAAASAGWLIDQPLYRMTSPLLTATASS